MPSMPMADNQKTHSNIMDAGRRHLFHCLSTAVTPAITCSLVKFSSKIVLLIHKVSIKGIVS